MFGFVTCICAWMCLVTGMMYDRDGDREVLFGRRFQWLVECNGFEDFELGYRVVVLHRKLCMLWDTIPWTLKYAERGVCSVRLTVFPMWQLRWGGYSQVWNVRDDRSSIHRWRIESRHCQLEGWISPLIDVEVLTGYWREALMQPWFSFGSSLWLPVGEWRVTLTRWKCL